MNETNKANEANFINMTNENIISKQKFKAINKDYINNDNKKIKGSNKFGFKK